jgi:uncharacterized damage-inducible protein DinB
MSVFTNAAGSTAEETQAYIAAILDLLGDGSPLDVLERTESALREAVRGLSAERLVAPEAPGKWSVRHVIQHLADSELAWGWRLRLVLAQDRPTLTGYDQDAWATRLHYEDIEVDDALDVFGTLRRANLRLLRRASPDELARVGVHAERGDESVAHMMRLYAGHDLLHLRQVARIREAVSAPSTRL